MLGITPLWYAAYDKRPIAVILGGGEGKRLRGLTKKRPKPGVQIAGGPRFVDIKSTLLLEAGIYYQDLIGGYEPFPLQQHWERRGRDPLFPNNSLRFIMPSTDEDLRKGTAEALAIHAKHRQEYILGFEPTDIVLVTADHITDLSYRQAMQTHWENDADVTVIVKRLPKEDIAGRLGCIQAKKGIVTGVYEKSDRPPSQLAHVMDSIWKREFLDEMVREFRPENGGSFEYTEDLLAKVVQQGCGKIIVYEQPGFWADAGTIKSYFDTNLLLADPEKAPMDYRRFLTSADKNSGAGFRTGKNVHLENCITHNGAYLPGGNELELAILANSVSLGEGTGGKEIIIADESIFGGNSWLEHLIVDKNCVGGKNLHLSPESLQPELVRKFYEKRGGKCNITHMKDWVLVQATLSATDPAELVDLPVNNKKPYIPEYTMASRKDLLEYVIEDGIPVIFRFSSVPTGLGSD